MTPSQQNRAGKTPHRTARAAPEQSSGPRASRVAKELGRFSVDRAADVRTRAERVVERVRRLV
jgi:hypothetical protein